MRFSSIVGRLFGRNVENLETSIRVKVVVGDGLAGLMARSFALALRAPHLRPLGGSVEPWFSSIVGRFFGRNEESLMESNRGKVVVGDGFEPSKALAGGFTVRPRWPLE